MSDETPNKEIQQKRRQARDPHTGQRQAINKLLADHTRPPAVEDNQDTPLEADIDDLNSSERDDGPSIPELDAREELEPEIRARVGSEQDAQVHEVIAQLQAEVQKLQGEIRRVETRTALPEGIEDAGTSGYDWMYYKRPEDGGVESGWIVIAPGGAVARGRYAGKRNVGAYTKYLRKGAIPLERYPVTPPPAATRGIGEEFHRLLQAGGAKEFPASQVLALKWHISPPIPGVTFPQYEMVKDRVLHFACPDCDWEFYTLDDNIEEHRAAFRHLRQTDSTGRHGYPREEANMVLEAQGFPSMAQFAAISKQRTIEKTLPTPPGEGAGRLMTAEEI